MIQRILLLALFLGTLFAHSSALALRFYVDGVTGDDRRSHVLAQDADTPWRTITHALRVAHLINEGRPHVIDIAAGTYSPARGETMPFAITQTGIYVRSQGNVLLDGQAQAGIFSITAPTSDFSLHDFSLLNGSAERGGAVYCNTCSLKVTNSRIINNVSSAGGDVVYVESGRLQFLNNTVRFNGSSGADGPLLATHDIFSDTTQRDLVRNNTFYLNDTPAVLTTGNRTDISNNIFVGKAGSKVPAIVDSVSGDQPLVRYNLFWETDVLYVSNDRDSINVVRTVRDTVTLEELGIELPSFVLNQPDTVAQVGSVYEYNIEVSGNKEAYNFNRVNPGDLPAGIADSDWDAGILRWTPAAADTGRHALRLEVISPAGQLDFVSYVVTVFTAENFPDTTDTGPIVNISFVPDTTGALDTLNAIVPSFSSAASAGGNIYGDPLFLNTDISNFQLLAGSPARDAGNPVIALWDVVTTGGQVRNDMGFTGGPANGAAPEPGSASEVGATALPDSFVVEGQTWTYTPTLDQVKNTVIIDYLQGPPTLKQSLGAGKSFPITWVPTLADTGAWLVGVKIFNSDASSARHYFPLRVRAANEPPRITSAAPAQAFEDSAFVYTLQIVEPDEDPVTFTLVSGPEGMTIDTSGVIRWVPDQADTGSVDVEVLVSDDGGESASQSFTLAVFNTNDAPLLAALGDTSATEDLPFALQLSATDPDLADSLFVFSLLSGPAQVTLDSSGALTWTPVQADVGAHPVTVQVADPQGAVDSTSFVITVIEVDDPPVITSVADTTAPEDALYEYTLAAIDEEGETVLFDLVSAPPAMTIDTVGTVRWTPTQADTGLHDIEIRASDPGGKTASQAYRLLVEAVNDPPTLLSRTPADSFFFFEPGQGVVFSVSATDEEDDLISYRWLVDGVLTDETSSQFLHVPDTTSADTVVTRILDGTDSTTVQWVVDARAIPIVILSADSLDFGSVVLGDSAAAEVTLSNPGRTTLVISDLQVSNLDLTAVFSASQVLENESERLSVRYVPTTRGALATTIQFGTNDPDRPTVSIPVRGVGLIPTQVDLDLDPATGNQAQLTGAGSLGDTVSIDLYVRSALDITQVALEFAFDDATLGSAGFDTAAAGSSFLPGASVTLAEPAGGQLHLSMQIDSTAGGLSGDGYLGRLRLTVAADAEPGSDTEVRVERVVLLSEGFADPDTLRPQTLAVIAVRRVLPADFNDDGIVDFDDFFIFADLFGTVDARGDLNSSGGIVDFDDFFLFADSFGAAARTVPRARTAGVDGLTLSAPARPARTDLIESRLDWTGDPPLRGLAGWIEYDPTQLEYLGIAAGEDTPALRWSRPLRPGTVQFAIARPREAGAFDGDLPSLRFQRLTPEAATVRLRHAVALTREGQRIDVAAPVPARIPALPADFVLYPAYPNPFNPATTLSLFVPATGGTEAPVRLRIYDLLGQPVRTLNAAPLRPGTHTFTWRGRNDAGQPVSAGVYLIEMLAPESRFVRKALYLK